jgi:hypothetical protein
MQQVGYKEIKISASNERLLIFQQSPNIFVVKKVTKKLIMHN